MWVSEVLLYLYTGPSAQDNLRKRTLKQIPDGISKEKWRGKHTLEFAVLAHWGWELKATHAYLNANKL